MEDLVAIREKINQMAWLAISMLRATFDGFMKHDRDILAGVLKDEEKLNEMERAITLSLVDIAKGEVSTDDKEDIIHLSNIVEDLEQIGDYIKDMIERIEIKIEERLLFSEDALKEYKHLYRAVESGLWDVVNSLKMNDKNFAKRLLCDEAHVDKLVEQYRDSHAKRFITGICLPRACNMYLNLLDFTAQIAHHTTEIAKNILELEQNG